MDEIVEAVELNAKFNHENLRVEYQEVGENIRSWQNFRFIQLTALIALVGGTLSIIFEHGNEMTHLLRGMVAIGGLVITLVFWIMDFRCVKYWERYLARGRQIEKILEYYQYTETPNRGLITGGNAINTLFLFLTILWIVILINF